MASSYLPTTDVEKNKWLKNFAAKLAVQGPSLGVTASEITTTTNDSILFSFILDKVDVLEKDLSELVAYKNALSKGEISNTTSPFPIISSIGTVPTLVPSGIFKRAGKIITKIKINTAYTNAIGQDLGIETHAESKSALMNQPILKIIIKGGKPELSYVKRKYSGIDIYVDRNDGKGYLFLATSVKSKWTDETKLDSTIKAAQWTYKAIYKKGDEQVGNFSNPMSVAISKQL